MYNMEFAGIHDKLHKQGLFNLNVNWPHFQRKAFQPGQSRGEMLECRSGKKRRKAVCRLHTCDG